MSGGGGSLISQLSWSGSEAEQLQAARQALEQVMRSPGLRWQLMAYHAPRAMSDKRHRS